MKKILNLLWISGLLSLMACQTDTTTTDKNNTQDSLKSDLSPNLNEKSLVATPKEAFDLVPEGIYRDLNAKLAASKSKMSAKEVIQMYYPAKVSNNTSFEKIDIQEKKEGSKTIVTLTHDNQSEHIRIQGHRILMTLEQKAAHWQIVSIQQQYKCWLRTEGALWSNDKCS